MLFDPKWNKPSLEGFITWLETKDPNEEYIFSQPNNCALGQYFRTLDQRPETYVDDAALKMGIAFMHLGYIVSPMFGPSTFGEALKRARNNAYVK